MNKFFCQWLAIIAGGSLLSGCTVSEKITAKFGKQPENSTITALDAKSTEALQSSKDLKNPVRVHLSYARWKEEAGDLGEAEKSYRLVLHKQPDNHTAKLGLARILMQQGRVSDAATLFQAVLKAAPDNPDVLLSVSQYYADQNDWNQSLQLLRRANQLDPQNKDVQFHLAVALANTGDIRGAYSQFRAVLPELDSHYNLARIFYKRGDMISAERHFARVLELDPGYKPAQEMLARIHPNQESQQAQYASHQYSRAERRTVPASDRRSSEESFKPFSPVFEYNEETTPPF